MLKNFWYAVEHSGELQAGKPLNLEVLGQRLVLYRDSKGAPVAMSDLCVHRGGALSGGWLKGDCIVCPYHGWEYEPSGACIKIPADRPGKGIPKKARVDAYPTAERHGFVWVFLGDLPEEERPPIPDLSELEDPGFRTTTGEFHWDAHYERVFENSMDVAHAPFVHGGNFGNRDKPEVPDFEIEQHEWGAAMHVTLEPPPAKGLWKKLYSAERKGVETASQFWLPNITKLQINLPFGTIKLFISHLPIDETRTVSKWVSARSFFTGRWADRDAVKRTFAIFEQDQKIVEEQRPELVPFDLSDELHVVSDRLQVVYRRMRADILARGWGIDQHQVRAHNPRGAATVIPSPARKEVPELARAWVHKEVPAVPPTVPDDASPLTMDDAADAATLEDV
jgi:phenylpropionate dioxygenase-like ring-hydroxylating dioxygenase large terminal subunit